MKRTNLIIYVDFNLNLKQMMEELVEGRFSEVHENARHFLYRPATGASYKEFEIEFFDANSDTTYDREKAIGFIKDFDKENPFEPAEAEHLVMFAVLYPDVARRLGIVKALGGTEPCGRPLLEHSSGNSFRFNSSGTLSGAGIDTSKGSPSIYWLAVRPVKR